MKNLKKIELNLFEKEKLGAIHSLIDFSDNYQAWALRQERVFGCKKDVTEKTREYISQIVREGESLSALGKLTINSDGEVVLSRCLALLAGGVPEARQFLKEKIGVTNTAVLCFGVGILICAGVFASELYELYNCYRIETHKRSVRDQFLEPSDIPMK